MKYNKFNHIIPQFLTFIPETDKLEPGILYISKLYKTASHLCPCGCGELVVTPLGITAEIEGWWLLQNGDKVTLSPSVGSLQLQCKSHYHIRNNKIEWC